MREAVIRVLGRAKVARGRAWAARYGTPAQMSKVKAGRRAGERSFPPRAELFDGTGVRLFELSNWCSIEHLFDPKIVCATQSSCIHS